MSTIVSFQSILFKHPSNGCGLDLPVLLLDRGLLTVKICVPGNPKEAFDPTEYLKGYIQSLPDHPKLVGQGYEDGSWLDATASLL